MWNKIYHFFSSRWFLSILISMSFILIFQSFLLIHKNRQKAFIEHETITFAYDMAAHFNREVNKLIYLSSGVEAYIKIQSEHIDSSELKLILKEIYEKESGLIRNFGIAEKYILKWVYPYKGNEKAIGLDYTKIPTQFPKVQKAIESKKGTMDGPVALVQGGRGIIYRSPVFVDSTYWGLISTVIDLENLFDSVFFEVSSNKFDIAISNKKRGDEDDLLYGKSEVFHSNKSTIIDLVIPNNVWYIAIQPTKEFTEENYLIWINVIGYISALLIFIITFYIKTLQTKASEIVKKYKVLSEKTTDVVWVYNIRHKKFTYFSPSVNELIGFTSAEVYDLRSKKIFAEDTIKQLKQNFPVRYREFLQAKDTQKSYVDHLRHKRKDGSIIWVETVSQFNINKEKQVEVIGVSRNVDIRKKAEIALQESENKFRSIFDSANDGYLVIDPESSLIVMGNQEIYKMLRYSASELVGRPLKILYTGNFDQCFNKRIKEIGMNRDRVKDSIEILRKDQTTFFADISTSEVIVEGVNYLFCSFRDVSRQQELQQELIKLNNEKDRFISLLAHDLRSPFNGLLGLLEYVVTDFDEMNEQEIKKMLAICLDTSSNLFEMLEELLLWSRSQSGKITIEPTMFNFKKLNSSIFDLYKSALEKKKLKVELNFEYDLNIFADEALMKIVTRNLISNAIKFSNMNGRIEVQAIETSKEYEIKVSDNGVGMDENILNNLWVYSMNESRRGTDNEKGSGFGLVLIKELINRMGGRIKAESEPLKGSVFTITLPK